MCATWTVVRKQVSQYLSIILHKNSLLLVLECLLSAPCLNVSSQVASRATELKNVSLLEALLPENWVQLISVATTAFIRLVHIQTADISHSAAI
jgi:hypothetical protein